ncbi:Odorant receptor Or2 [Dufourea novaeangliae]|uniref:Odorant receptor Or2 n=1 Tax=Dufourea novaeangliae TaxID=178035 RepID=A0A154P2G2_DUFNO|nr:Odorant receptor Or2 [Dufourea novaeangliae]
MMENDWNEPKTDAERNVMIQYAGIARKFAKFCHGAIVFLTFTLLFLQKLGMPVRHTTKETEMFIFSTYYVIDVSRRPYFQIILILQLISLFAQIYAYVGVDIFFGMLVLHISAQLENLRTRLLNIKTSNRFDRVLMDTVMRHTRLIRAVDVIENTYTLLLLMLLLYFGLFNCLCIFEIITIINGKDNYSASVLYFQLGSYINTCVQTSLYCITGQFLATQSERVYEAVYDCEWLNLKPKDAKNLILIMMRSRKPLYVTAGKLFPITMLTFCNVLKVSFSYMSFLLTKV